MGSRVRRRVVVAAAVVALALGAVFVPRLVAESPSAPARRESLAQYILRTGRGRFFTSAALSAVRMQASGNRSFGAQALGNLFGPESDSGSTTGIASAPVVGAAATPAGWANQRVNNPALDTREEQTTQSETAIGAVGSHVVVGYNDSQQTLLALTSGSSLTGFSYSDNGGAVWQDGGALPNGPGRVNLGDPWIAADRAGHFFFSNLALGADGLGVSVARSDNFGHTWRSPITVSEPGTQNDKDAMTVGRDPLQANRDNVYVSWDDLSCDSSGVSCFAGLPVAHSTDGGNTWSVSYADKIAQGADGCSFAQYLGAQPLVDPRNGTLYVAAERIAVDDPDCTFAVEPTFQEVVFASQNGGVTFGPVHVIGNITEAAPSGVIDLAPGQAIRTAEFPVLAIDKGTLYAAWNQGTATGARIRLATSGDGGKTWSKSWATSPGPSVIDLQPALDHDSAGLHLSYYEIGTNRRINVLTAASSNGGATWTRKIVTTASFGGVPNAPQFDPVIAEAYMGDYIAAIASGGKQLVAWGDNRDVVHDALWPGGRNDPNVYFAAG